MTTVSLVTGAGGFIGGHLVRRLLDDGHQVVATDLKPLKDWWQIHESTNLGREDLRNSVMAANLVRSAAPDLIWHEACPMGGIAHITANLWDCARSSVMTGNVIQAAIECGVQRMFLSSSACAYNTATQQHPDVTALHEGMAWPALPEEGYGLSKLFEEKMCEYASHDTALETRVARYHNVMGPNGSWEGGKEKAPAAICRKVAEAELSGVHRIDIWGDGEQTRSFCWVDDCVEGTVRLMASDHAQPLNIGSSELVSINRLVDLAETAAFGRSGVLERVYDLSAPQGVRGRNSDNTLCREVLGWEPQVSLAEGVGRLYPWVREQVERRQPHA